MIGDAGLDALGRTIDEKINELNTIMPGVILSYDAGTNRAVVRPSLPRRLADGTDLAAPQIVSVVVKWPAGGGALLTFPIKAGDPCELRFSQRSLDGWQQGNAAGADDPRAFDLSDAICDPGLSASGVVGDNDAVVLKFGACSIRMSATGITFATAGGTLTLDADGKLTNTQDIVAGAISLQTHKSSLVQPGSGASGVPVP